MVPLGMLAGMAISEAARHDLYNGLADLLGPERAETLMTYLPSYDPSEIATKADIGMLRSEMRDLEARLAQRIDGVEGGLVSINQRLDRLFLALVAGLFLVLAAMATAVFAVA